MGYFVRSVLIRFTPPHFLSKVERRSDHGVRTSIPRGVPRARRCARWCRTDGGPCAPRRAATKSKSAHPRRPAVRRRPGNNTKIITIDGNNAKSEDDRTVTNTIV